MLRGDIRDAILTEALAKGAHGFLLKPLRARELVVRLGAALRRHRPLVASEPGHGPARSSQIIEADVLTVGPGRLEVPMQRAFLDNKKVLLTSKEWALAFFNF
jgi:DNA-binding response OmpR family regulator